jgi:fumarate hydratase class II
VNEKYRIEKDSLGEVKVPEKALYGAQTQRAVDNFVISGIVMPDLFIRSLGLIKAASSTVSWLKLFVWRRLVLPGANI